MCVCMCAWVITKMQGVCILTFCWAWWSPLFRSVSPAIICSRSHCILIPYRVEAFSGYCLHIQLSVCVCVCVCVCMRVCVCACIIIHNTSLWNNTVLELLDKNYDISIFPMCLSGHFRSCSDIVQLAGIIVKLWNISHIYMWHNIPVLKSDVWLKLVIALFIVVTWFICSRC